MPTPQLAPALWFAHSLEDRPEEEWEPLRRHLNEVRQGAGARAAKFDAANLGGVAGLLHDLGKYKPEFLAYIRGQGRSPDHASAGANHARSRLGTPGLVLAHVIAAHHAGLKDGLFAQDGRLDRTLPELARVQATARVDGIALPESVPLPGSLRPAPGEEGFQLAFLTRTLLSCLVDADRVATAAFYAAAEGRSSAPAPRVSMAELAEALAAWMGDKAAQRADDQL